ncbi:hypothetical protein LCGC14_1666690 [marine sediment metagenome]|uniref:Uncharacterized protein n=1 Tax=marine sediment metagenome TaxID=412755 RepID=A0A0F9KSF0_9ZZZZ
MTKKPKCPWFGEPCLRNNCLSYIYKQEERFEGTMGVRCFTTNPYCNSLKIFIPNEIKEMQDE